MLLEPVPRTLEVALIFFRTAGRLFRTQRCKVEWCALFKVNARSKKHLVLPCSTVPSFSDMSSIVEDNQEPLVAASQEGPAGAAAAIHDHDLPGPSRQLRLSKFDSQGLRAQWKDEAEKKAADEKLSELSGAFETILTCLDDPRPLRDGLRKTPLRAAKALLFFTKGYEEDLGGKRALCGLCLSKQLPLPSPPSGGGRGGV